MNESLLRDTRYMANPDVVCEHEPDRTVLFNADTGRSQATNAMGLLIWKALACPLTLKDAVAHVIQSCEDVPVEQVADDVHEFLQPLLHGGFVGEVV